MKIHTLASWGLLIALTQQVAAQEPCTLQVECLGNTYCNSISNTCLPLGGCVEVSDCSDEANFPYAMPLCLGTTICNDGFCDIDCGNFPLEDDKVKCTTSEDCPVSLDGTNQYCASDGVCEEMGGCAIAEDCGNRENQGFMLAACVGTITCTERRCGIECDGADVSPEIPGGCLSHEDCPVGGYCASDGQCEKIGGCATVGDCWLEENQGFPIPACIGDMQCVDRRCDMMCTGSDALFPCLTSDQCVEPETYCNSFETCTKNGSCVTDEDCSMEGNFYMEIECIGRKYCDEMGQCAKDCSAAPIGAYCRTTLDCADGEYCAGSGFCLPSGACDVPEDCTALDNDIFFPACLGTIFCEEGMCGKMCDGAGGEPFPTKEGEDGSAVDIDIFCTTDAECNTSVTTATTRSGFPHEELYCAAGTCKKQGHCSTDFDCINPSNIFFSDKRCTGYLYCTEEGTCDRECSTLCKDGSIMAQCFSNPCDTNDWESCENAASCVLDTCGKTCDYMLFDAAGNKLADCAIAEDPIMDGSVSITKDNGSTDFVTREGEDSAQEIMSLESSAVRATSLVAVVALALGVVMV